MISEYQKGTCKNQVLYCFNKCKLDYSNIDKEELLESISIRL